MIENFFRWLTQPVSEIVEIVSDRISKAQISEYIPDLPFSEKYLSSFRPSFFRQYIGQERAKDILQSYITAIKKRQITFPHTLIYGHAGFGKTTLARILAGAMNVNFVEVITSEIKSSADLYCKIIEADGGILFLDEIHALERGICESIYTVMEDFQVSSLPRKPFTLIGATTELGEILRTRRPFYDRFKIILELEEYNFQNLREIAIQYKIKMFPDDILTSEVYDLIAKNSRGTPRTVIRLLEASVYLNGDIRRVLRNFAIICDGFTEKDLKILEYITQHPKGVGLQGLVAYLDTSQYNYQYQIEPYLLSKNLVIRTPRGRKITINGVKKIEELKQVLERGSA